ncbi:EF-hand domain-containing protein [Stenotrophomonas sp. C3(2023)]|uniref:EF-hand domain-containing protein n=1 Tax=Stenotrophomonas sp. C3(2023) TaxID=3080277 RepID=UPI00293D012C|nr:EF-hand domain-containing protein [Stenotrophomonas sp. C3(2023)]MDV3467231.1 EF-hand domain-containing protein [Stenotrophomonas sp. C3(2023)]
MKFATPHAIMSAMLPPYVLRPAFHWLRRTLVRGAVPLLLLPFATVAQVTDTASYLQRMDTDGDGRVSEAEYLAWMLYAFDQLDRNGDGVLTSDELPGGKGRPITRAQQRQTLVARFHRQDADGDGYLSARELAAPPR